ncbi:plasmid recombination protein [Duganella callida]|nr:plasmid recombination protein [Duganella callida]
MTDSLYLRLKSLNTRSVRGVTSPKNIVRVAAMHNLREIQAELGASAASGINPARMHLNYQLRGPATADEVAGLALVLLDNAGVTTLRRDACMALELVVSLPAAAAIDHREYFTAAITWADAYFNVPILSAAVHLDEAAPHCHILLLPLVAGRMQGGALAGGPAKIRAMLADFQQQVAQRFGLTYQPRAKRLSKPSRDAAGRMVLDTIRARPERLSEPAMRDALIAALGTQAETLLALLGLSMPATKAKAKSFADIMTAPCKPERASRAAPDTKLVIDIAQNLSNKEGEKFDNVYLCVDIAPSPSPIPADEQPTVHAADGAADQPATGDVQQQDGQGMQNILDTPPPRWCQRLTGTHAACLNTSSAGGRRQHAARVDQYAGRARESGCSSPPTPAAGGSVQRAGQAESLTPAGPPPTLPASQDVVEVLVMSTGGGSVAGRPAPNGESTARWGSIDITTAVGDTRTCRPRKQTEFRDQYARVREGTEFSEHYARARELAEATGPPQAPAAKPGRSTNATFSRYRNDIALMGRRQEHEPNYLPQR